MNYRVARRDDRAYDIVDRVGAQVGKAATRDVAILFAAAPDLLAALKAIVEAVDDEWEGPPFSEALLTERDHRLLHQAHVAITAAESL